MESIPTTTILDRGVTYLTNHPDALAKRIVLAQVLVDARAVQSIEAGVVAFRIWATAGAKEFSLEDIFILANEKAKT